MVRILFLHPDLGIGGAERLIVDAALALKQHGHQVSFLTNHHNPDHCFPETADGTLPVEVVGDWLPRSIFGHCYAVCAYIRMIYAAFYASFCIARRRETIDVFVCDLISVCIPFLRLARPKPRILFYCHFPDQLLSQKRGWLKRVYRAPIDFLEEYTISLADKVLVNSKFTLRVFQSTFRRFTNKQPEVLYPAVNTDKFDALVRQFRGEESTSLDFLKLPSDAYIFLDINRYERKKDHLLAVYAFRYLRDELSESEFKRCFLVIAGGYDERVRENVDHFKELKSAVDYEELENKIKLLRSPSDEEKFKLLYAAHCLIYTPENEHFGIVPLEGMYFLNPVIASNSGGPVETVVHKQTGLLCEQNAESFGKAMLELLRNDELRIRMGIMGHKRVELKFSFEAFAFKLNEIIEDLLSTKRT